MMINSQKLYHWEYHVLQLPNIPNVSRDIASIGGKASDSQGQAVCQCPTPCKHLWILRNKFHVKSISATNNLSLNYIAGQLGVKIKG